jgi:branched-chain amino acid transport system permease protein
MTVIWAGLASGAIYALVAMGYNFTMTTAGVLNFAYAHFIMVGSFVAAWGLQHGYPLVVVILAAGVLGAAIGGLEERIAIRLLPTGSTHTELVTTVGVGTVLTGLAIVLFGSDPMPVPILRTSLVHLFGATVSVIELMLIGIAIILGAVLHIWTRRTRSGLASLARSEDREAAMLRGVNVRRLSLLAFVAAGAIGGLLGPVVGAKTFASAFLPIVLAIKGFTALTLGGVGSQLGALLGGLSIGLVEAAAQYWWGVNAGDIAVFVIFLAVLLTRPHGLFGEREARLV